MTARFQNTNYLTNCPWVNGKNEHKINMNKCDEQRYKMAQEIKAEISDISMVSLDNLGRSIFRCRTVGPGTILDCHVVVLRIFTPSFVGKAGGTATERCQ